MKRSDATQAYNDVEAQGEATRCLQCEDPYCSKGCPAGIDVRGFINDICTENLIGAARKIRSRNILGLTCGIVCPIEQLCEKECLRSKLNYPITIGRLQRFVCEQDYERGLFNPQKAEPKGKKVAVLGSGPAGLAAAAELVLRGYEVTLFEKRDAAGGVLRNGVPRHRLERDIVDKEVAFVQGMGVNMQVAVEAPSLDQLQAEGFAATFIAVGMGTSRRIGLAGEDLDGVYTALEFLDACVTLPLDSKPQIQFGPRVVVIGGGDVAMDCARTALLYGATKAETVCLEAPNEMPSTMVEVEHAWDEGVIFHTRIMPKEILGQDGKVAGLYGASIEWKEPERYVPSNAVEIEGSDITLKCDTVVLAIGQCPEDGLASGLLEGLELDRGGRIVVDENTYMTSRPGVFAGGDIIVDGGPTVVRCVAQGKAAAEAIDAYLAGR